MRQMAESTREIEIKLPFASPDEARDRLLARGATLRSARCFEDNVVLDTPDRALARQGRLLRLRRTGKAAVLTAKAPAEGCFHHKIREERETPIPDPDALLAILEASGFEIAWRYQKWRTEYALGRVLATVDETAIGCFVELEGEPAAIDAEAAGLGFSPDRFLTATYRELFERWAAERSVPAGDLLLDLDHGGAAR